MPARRISIPERVLPGPAPQSARMIASVHIRKLVGANKNGEVRTPLTSSHVVQTCHTIQPAPLPPERLVKLRGGCRYVRLICFPKCGVSVAANVPPARRPQPSDIACQVKLIIDRLKGRSARCVSVLQPERVVHPVVEVVVHQLQNAWPRRPVAD